MVQLPAVENTPLSARGPNGVTIAAGEAVAASGAPSVPTAVDSSTVAAAGKRLAHEEVRLLKEIIRIQQRRIEELQSSSVEELQSPDSPSALSQQSGRTGSKSPRFNEDILEKVKRLSGEVRRLRQDNKELKRANRRMRDMLEQERGLPDSEKPVADSGAEASGPPSPSRASERSSSPVRRRSLTAGPLRRLQAQSFRPSKDSLQALQLHAGIFKKLLREASARAVCKLLFESVKHLERLAPGVIFTLYVFDPSVKQALSSDDQRTTNDVFDRPTHFYLDRGKIPVEGYRKDGFKAEPPSFADLALLPVKQHKVLALPLQVGNNYASPLAALQATFPHDEDIEHSPSAARERKPSVVVASDGDSTPVVASSPSLVRNPERKSSQKLLRAAAAKMNPESGSRIRVLSEGDEEEEEDQRTGIHRWSEADILALEMLCQIAAQNLTWQHRAAALKVSEQRMQKAMAVIAEVMTCNSISSFESLLRVHLMELFGATAVRFGWYDPNSQVLFVIATPSRPVKSGAQPPSRKSLSTVGVRQVKRFKLTDGIVARCAKKGQVIRIERLSAWKVIHDEADGVSSNLDIRDSMLAGPLTMTPADEAASSQVVGTLQLIVKGGSKDRAVAGAFSYEDEVLFTALLRSLGTAAYRVMQVQASRPPEKIELETLTQGIYT